jgi:dye decolorizing peroxidase
MNAPRLSRRALVQGAAVSAGLVGLGAAGGVGGALAHTRSAERAGWGSEATVPFYGRHQAALEHPATSFARHLAFDLRPSVDAGAIRRMLRILTEDAAALTAGSPPLADSEPELAQMPSRLMVTVGFGPELVRRAAGSPAVPHWLGPLPSFSIDRLEPRYTGGDLLLIVQADDPVAISHAARVLQRQTRSFVSLRWSLDGFRRAPGVEPAGATMRNLFGQVDGTQGPHPEDEAYARAVWGEGVSTGNPSWLDGGTGFVLRRIQMDLDTWDEVDRPDRERAVGRRLDNGAPLTGQHEHDPADFSARDSRGLPVIPDFAHMRRARARTPEEVFARRGYNYEIERGVGDGPEAGQLFEAIGYDPSRQFVPAQRRLDGMDMMNLWITPVGSGVFALPPGCEPGKYIGQTLV